MKGLLFATCVLAWLASVSTAHAYTDPGFGALLFQMLAAAFVGGLYYLYRFRSWFAGLLRRILSKKNSR